MASMTFTAGAQQVAIVAGVGREAALGCALVSKASLAGAQQVRWQPGARSLGATGGSNLHPCRFSSLPPCGCSPTVMVRRRARRVGTWMPALLHSEAGCNGEQQGVVASVAVNQEFLALSLP